MLISLTVVTVCLMYTEYDHIFPNFNVYSDNNPLDPLCTNLSTVIPETLDLNCHHPSQVHLLQYLNPSINASCELLFKGDKQERQRIRNVLKSWKPPNDIKTIELIKDCQRIRTNFMDNFYISETERNFPLAFQMPVYYQQNFLLQHIRLLKYLYRPHNIYCIHVDKKSPKWWTDGLRQFTKCFNNIFISTKQVHIFYGSVSILDAHLSCLKDLVNVTADWRYVITLNSPEIPLVTNKEMVDTLIKMNGTNIMTNGFDALHKTFKNGSPNKYYQWLMRKKVIILNKGYLTRSRLGPIPYNLHVLKSASSVNSAMSRDFVKFVVTDKRALALRERLEYVNAAEEFFFVTLNELKDAPGNRHTIKEGVSMPRVSRRLWQFSYNKKTECIEKYFIHKICIQSASDLPYLRSLSGIWFLNKYRIDYDHVVMDCMEELLLKRHYKEYEIDCISKKIIT